MPRPGRSALAVTALVVALLFLYGAARFHASAARHMADLRPVVIPEGLEESVEWRPSNYPGLRGNIFKPGRMVLTRDLELRPANGDGRIVLARGNSVACWTCTARPVPFLASLALIVWIAGAYLLASSIRPVRLPRRAEEALIVVPLILLLASLVFAVALPHRIDARPGSTGFLSVERETVANENLTIVLNGTLITSNGLIAEEALDAVVILLLVGYATLFFGVAARLSRG